MAIFLPETTNLLNLLDKYEANDFYEVRLLNPIAPEFFEAVLNHNPHNEEIGAIFSIVIKDDSEDEPLIITATQSIQSDTVQLVDVFCFYGDTSIRNTIKYSYYYPSPDKTAEMAKFTKIKQFYDKASDFVINECRKVTAR